MLYHFSDASTVYDGGIATHPGLVPFCKVDKSMLSLEETVCQFKVSQ